MSEITPGVERTLAALEQTHGKTISKVDFEADGIVIRFVDETALEIGVGGKQAERKQVEPELFAIFRASRKGSAA